MITGPALQLAARPVPGHGAGFALTLVLPEPAGRSLEDMPTSAGEMNAPPLAMASQHQPTEDPASAA